MTRLSEANPKQPTATFWGAAQTVTGSMHLIEAVGRRILLDCGKYRGRRDEGRQSADTFPFEPAQLDAVILSHAHTDHCGNLPNLVRQGFHGPIFCTPATRDLTAIMLADSARIHDEDAVVAGVVGRGSSPGAPIPFTASDVVHTVRQCESTGYGKRVETLPGVHLRFLDAGHILGSAIVELVFEQGARTHRLTFTGDLGRRGLPFLPEPSAVPGADLLISESTYGDRLHDSLDAMSERLSRVVRTTVNRGGKVLVPAFSLGRTQLVVHFLRTWMRDGLLPRLPLYVDSPLASEIAHVYDEYANDLRAFDGTGLPPVEYLKNRDEAQSISMGSEPCILVASGGMCEGGRVMQHLKHHVDDPRSTILLVSYQAPQTLGRQLLEKRPTVRFHGKTWNKWAEVVEVNGFSGHADRNDFVALLGPVASETKKVRLVHGEPEQAEALAKTLRAKGFRDIGVARRGESVSFD